MSKQLKADSMSKQLTKESAKLRELESDFTNLITLCQCLKSNYKHYNSADIRAVEGLLDRMAIKIEYLQVKIWDQETRVGSLQLSLNCLNCQNTNTKHEQSL